MNRSLLTVLTLLGFTAHASAQTREQWIAEMQKGAVKAEQEAIRLTAEIPAAKAMTAFQLEVDALRMRETAATKRELAVAVQARDDAKARELDAALKLLAAKEALPAMTGAPSSTLSSPAAPTDPAKTEFPAGWNPAGVWKPSLPSDPADATPPEAPGPNQDLPRIGAFAVQKHIMQSERLKRLAEEQRERAKADRDVRRAANECADLLEERAELLSKLAEAFKTGNTTEMGKLERKLKDQTEDFVKLAKKWRDDSFLPLQLFP